MNIQKGNQSISPVSNIKIERAMQDQDGNFHFQLSGPKGRMLLNLNTFMEDEKVGFAALKFIGLIMLSTKPKNEFKKLLEAVTEFEDAVVATQPGFVTPTIYIHPNGDITHSNDCIIEPLVSFKTDDRYSTCGKFCEWKKGLSAVIEDNAICAFLLCYGFLPFLLKLSPLKFNPTLELISPPEFGKSGGCSVAASINGGSPDSDNGLATSWDMTKNAYPVLRRMASDCLLYVDESNMQSEDIKQSGLISFVQASTGDKARFTDLHKPKPVWCALLSNGNEHPSERFKGNTQTIKASETRRITLVLDEPIFTVENWEKVRAHVDTHYGWASRRYVKKIVNACAQDEKKFKQRINDLMQEFNRTIDPDTITSQRILDVCALTYAAGALAKEWGILPAKCLNPADAVSDIYKKVVADKKKSKPKSAERIVRNILSKQKANNIACDAKYPAEKLADEDSIFSYFIKHDDGSRTFFCNATLLRMALGTNHRSILQVLRDNGILAGERGVQSKLTCKAPGYIGFKKRVYKLNFPPKH